MRQFILFISLIISIQGFCQIQIGNDIIGENPTQYLGYSVHTSDDGNRIFVCGFNYSQVYEYDGTNWVKLGNSIDGELVGASNSFAFSGDGMTVARGIKQGTFAGQVIIYRYDGNDWVQKGQTLIGNTLDYLGSSLTMSFDGNRLAVYSGLGSDFKGRISVFEYDNSNWVQIGSDILGDLDDDRFGSGISMSHDGNILAGGTLSKISNNPGYVRIFEYNGSDWVQLGSDIASSETSDKFGNAISLSEDGTTIVIGAHRRGSYSEGLVQVYQYQNNDWEQVGNDLPGTEQYENFGASVSISNNGNKIAVGANLGGSEFSNPYTNETGDGFIFEFNGTTWEEILKVEGEEFESLGYHVAISGDGNKIVCGSPSYDVQGNEGRVKVFTPENIPTSTHNEHLSLFKIYPIPAKGNLNLDLDRNYKNIEVEILDVTGRIISNHKYSDQKNISLNLESPGIFILNIKLDGMNYHSMQIINMAE